MEWHEARLASKKEANLNIWNRVCRLLWKTDTGLINIFWPKPRDGAGIVSCSGASRASQPQSRVHTDGTSRSSMFYSCQPSPCHLSRLPQKTKYGGWRRWHAREADSQQVRTWDGEIASGRGRSSSLARARSGGRARYSIRHVADRGLQKNSPVLTNQWQAKFITPPRWRGKGARRRQNRIITARVAHTHTHKRALIIPT